MPVLTAKRKRADLRLVKNMAVTVQFNTLFDFKVKVQSSAGAEGSFPTRHRVPGDLGNLMNGRGFLVSRSLPLPATPPAAGVI